jgi:hypothetical protein
MTAARGKKEIDISFFKSSCCGYGRDDEEATI